MTITETIDDLLFAAKGSPLGKPSAIVLTPKALIELRREHGIVAPPTAYREYKSIPIVTDRDAVGVSLRYT